MVDAGPDQIACEGDTVALNATILGGTPPYIIEWDTLIVLESTTFAYNVNSYLTNTNTLNPTIKSKPGNDNLFRIKITDSLGNVCYDTVKVRFSQWTFILADCYHSVPYGDSVNLFAGASSNRMPQTYAWYPNYNISDTTSGGPIAWPDSSMFYHVIVTDSFGCTASGACTINIWSVGINDKLLDDNFDFEVNSKITITPKFSLTKSDYKLRIFDVTGKLLNELPIEGQTSLDKLNKGLLIYAIYENEQLVFTRKVR